MNGKFTDQAMLIRDNKLRQARKNAERCQKELKKDRDDLSRKEKVLMKQVKAYALKGEMNKAKLVSQQIARYRAVEDRNFATSIMIETKAQMMYSTHKVSRAQVESVKGIQWVNGQKNALKVRDKQFKTAQQLHDYEILEAMMNDGMDDIYDTTEDQFFEPTYFEDEVDCILKESIDDVSQKKDYKFVRSTLIQAEGQSKIRLLMKRYYSPFDGESDSNDFGLDEAIPVHVSTLDLSIDMLKRELLKDPFALKKLGILPNESAYSLHESILGTTSRYFSVGLVDEKGTFIPFDYTSSLKSLGMKPNSTIWVYYKSPNGANNSVKKQ